VTVEIQEEIPEDVPAIAASDRKRHVARINHVSIVPREALHVGIRPTRVLQYSQIFVVKERHQVPGASIVSR
jgi:hypothetical protein